MTRTNTPLNNQSIIVVMRFRGSSVSPASIEASGELCGNTDEDPMWVQTGSTQVTGDAEQWIPVVVLVVH